MHVTVAGKQVETGEALQTHVREGLAAITRKYFDHALEANVTFRRDVKGKAGAFACDINLKAGRNLFMRGEGEGADAHRAFEVAAEHVAKRLRRYRRRVNDHARSMAEPREAEAETATQYVLQHEEETEDLPAEAAKPDHGVVVAEQPTEIARLTVGEAVMRLDLTHQPVLMFRNSGSGALNVVYRRPDGCIGWIDAPAA
ncbi:ribosome hibernation-promoting factor, HPF/YfiA family [Paracraurococcus ruber]|uniref:Ribosome hibernation promoting factor n=1 Tax=Paracraurococcus ruber TaxID=77675 RepID=A0ABS1CUG0_9PROT|nr:ribosome-associated translation inhibitor RaiA [Paracraurococcus ruber]MBK1657861.1 ribosomal subunit interface protein [Paracraurococcus ruber]TDG33543.1 ribosome-associated translation inhibitor RaiA [Paracraurococcus ruber]